MRILLVANTLPPADLSGVGEQVLQLASGLRGRGHEVEILGRSSGNGGEGARGAKLAFPLRIVRPALAKVERFRPDVVQVHESDGGLFAAALARRRSRPLLVALLQVSYAEERRAVRPLRWGAEELGRPGAVERRFRLFKAPLQIALGRKSARAADLVLAPSAATARELERDYGARGVEVVPNASGGWAVEERPMEGFDAPRAPLLFVGRLRIRKGVEVLLRALALDGGDRELRIVGDGEHRAALETAARRFGVASRVRFLGRRPAGEIRWALSRALALVVPSTYEGMPLVVLEAMAAGRAVVASRVSGIPEVVRDGETGWLVDAERPDQLAAALAEAGERDAAARRGAAGRARFELEYRPPRVAETWERIVTARLGARSPERR
jgi:glycosyltransferase involved in cell wall biosynthesis